MIRCVIYARSASDRQNERSTARQVRLCREFAAAAGWTVVAVCADEAISGCSAARPGLRALLDIMRSGRVGVVLAQSLDRLSRDQAEIADLHDQARAAGVQIVTIAEGKVGALDSLVAGTAALGRLDLTHLTKRGQEAPVREHRSGKGSESLDQSARAGCSSEAP